MLSSEVTMEDNRQKETPREQNQRPWRAMDKGVSQKKQKQSKHGTPPIAEAKCLYYFFLEIFLVVGHGC